MTGILPSQGENLALRALINQLAPQDLDLRLYKNNYVPVAGTVEGSLTEADFTGYAHIALVAGNWVMSGGDPTLASYPIQTFTSSADSQNQNVYGYYITQRSSGKLIGVERFSNGPFNIANNGDIITVTAVLSGLGE